MWKVSRLLPNNGKSQDFCRIVESCGLPDRVNKLFGTKIMALFMLFVNQEK
jgi:hypothetical protein